MSDVSQALAAATTAAITELQDLQAANDDLTSRNTQLSGENTLQAQTIAANSARIDQLNAEISDLQAQLDALELPDPPAPELVPLSGGLRDRDTVVAGSTHGTVVKITWAEVQKVRGGPLDLTKVKAAVATGRPVSVRPILGAFSPQFVKDLCGTYNHLDPTVSPPKTYLSPNVWHPLFLTLAGEFYSQLAGEIDEMEGVEIVFASAAMSGPYAEPHVRGFADPTTRANALAVGYAPDKDKALHRGACDLMAVFKRLHVAISLNGHQVAKAKPDGTSSINIDPAFTAEMMDRYRALSAGALLYNNSIRKDYLPGIDAAEDGTYKAMLARGGPIGFQTAQPSKIGDEAAVVAWCVSVDAVQVELPHPTSLSATQQAPFDAGLKANAAGDPPADPPEPIVTVLGCSALHAAELAAVSSVPNSWCRCFGKWSDDGFDDVQLAEDRGEAVLYTVWPSPAMFSEGSAAGMTAFFESVGEKVSGLDRVGFLGPGHEPEDQISKGQLTVAQYIAMVKLAKQVWSPLEDDGWQVMQVFMGTTFSPGGGHQQIADLYVPGIKAVGTDSYFWRGSPPGSTAPWAAASAPDTVPSVADVEKVLGPPLNWMQANGVTPLLTEYGVTRRQADTAGVGRTNAHIGIRDWHLQRAFRFAVMAHYEHDATDAAGAKNMAIRAEPASCVARAGLAG